MKQICKVYIVDDSALMLQLLSDRLDELAGVQIVGQAATVAEAIHSVQQLQPDVVILDLRLLDGSGLDVLAAV